MADNTPKKYHTIMVLIFVVSFLSAIGSNFYHFLYKKDYNYLVEASCDPQTENCFFRDCESAPDECPPNALSYYKSYYVDANDFKKCSDNSCLAECASGAISCQIVSCSEENDDTCVGMTK